MTITAKFPSTCAACGGRILAGEQINWTRGEPATHAPGCPEAPVMPEVEELPVPQETTRAGRMMAAGGIDATLVLANGDHVSLIATALVRVDGEYKRAALTDPGARVRVAVAKHGQRIGWIGDQFAIEWDHGLTDELKAGVRMIFRVLTGQNVREVEPVVEGKDRIVNADDVGLYPTDPDAGWTRLTFASECGRCGLTLRDPVSIARGIGPVCLGKITGSHHVPVREKTDDVLPFDEAEHCPHGVPRGQRCEQDTCDGPTPARDDAQLLDPPTEGRTSRQITAAVEYDRAEKAARETAQRADSLGAMLRDGRANIDGALDEGASLDVIENCLDALRLYAREMAQKRARERRGQRIESVA